MFSQYCHCHEYIREHKINTFQTCKGHTISFIMKFELILKKKIKIVLSCSIMECKFCSCYHSHKNTDITPNIEGSVRNNEMWPNCYTDFASSWCPSSIPFTLKRVKVTHSDSKITIFLYHWDTLF